MTDKEILKRVEDRLDVAIGNYEITDDGLKSSDWAFAIEWIRKTRSYIRTCRELQKKLRKD